LQGKNLPVWMYVCFFISDFWWNLLPQYMQGNGRVSLCIRRWVAKVDDRLNVLPHCLQENTRSSVCTTLCWSRLTSWPNVLLQISQVNGRDPVCVRRTWTSNPCAEVKILSQLAHVKFPIDKSMAPSWSLQVRLFSFNLIVLHALTSWYIFLYW
jgi:hypothetical protein